jgi:large subunit ribosomal protein L21
VVNDAGEVMAGTDAASAKVSAKIENHGRAEKVIVFKFKRKKQYKKTQGHRQGYTQVMVTGIEA